MTDRPILFNGAMVRTILDGNKTQTRRVLKPQPPEPPAAQTAPNGTAKHPAPYLDAYCGELRTERNPRGMSRNWHWWQVDDRPGVCVTRAPCAPGDRLWVRETCHAEELPDGLDGVRFSADNLFVPIQNTVEESDKWGALYHYRHAPEGRIGHTVPSIHMPRWASRLTLTVTDVRVEKVQDISEADARAEGIEAYAGIDPECSGYRWYGNDAKASHWLPPVNSFRTLWDSINGKGGFSWDANPWVVAITFESHHGNIDRTGDTA